MNFKRIGNSLTIQWLRLHILNSGGTVQSLAGETKIMQAARETGAKVKAESERPLIEQEQEDNVSQ